MTRPLFVAAVGSAHDPGAWSGIPYHLSEAGKAAGFVTEGLPFAVDGMAWKARRAAWNAMRVATGDRKGGFQYSKGFLERLWRPARRRLRGGTVINCFQLFAPSVLSDPEIRKWCFIDLTLTQLFDYYSMRPTIGRRIAADALAREKEAYGRLEGIVAMSTFAANSIHRDYGVESSRIHVVTPGANLDPVEYRAWEQEEARRRSGSAARRQPLRLVMVTTDWRRKGLDRLLRALAAGRRRGLRATLKIVGAARHELPQDLADVEGVEWLGRISKRTHPRQFLQAVCDADVGCILARYEAGGSVLREYHALGLAALTTTAGGMPDFMFPEAAITVAPDASDDEILAKLMEMEGDRDLVESRRTFAWNHRHDATWDESVRRLRALIPR